MHPSKIAIVSCIHGDEKYGLKVIDNLPNSIPHFIANKKALAEGKRYIESDLNRIFPGKPNGDYEQRKANELLSQLKDFEIIIDLHSTSNECPLFAIITKPNKQKIDLAERLGLERAVLMSPHLAKGGSLIDHLECGISLEVGPHEREENVQEVTEKIKNLLKNKPKNKNMKFFKGKGLIKQKYKKYKRICIKNFKPVKKGETLAIKSNGEKKIAQFDFTPILVNERSYPNILCLTSKQIKKPIKFRSFINKQ